MPKFYQTKKFKQLNAKWADKIAKDKQPDGKPAFKDIEHDEDTLSAYSSRYLKYPTYVWDLKSAYYSLCESFLQKYEFESNYERIVWEYHTNGLGVREIAKILRKLKYRKKGQFPVWKTVHRLESIMKQTYLSDEEPDEYFS